MDNAYYVAQMVLCRGLITEEEVTGKRGGAGWWGKTKTGGTPKRTARVCVFV